LRPTPLNPPGPPSRFAFISDKAEFASDDLLDV
jgi:hypothetical protein